MTMPSWPSNIPFKALLNRQTLDRSDTPVLESEFEYGNVELRRVSAARIRLVSISMAMTQGEFATFETFVRDDLISGTKSFSYQMDSFHGDRPNVICQLVRGGYTAARSGTSVNVSFQLRVYG